MSKPGGRMIHFEGTFTGYYSTGSSLSSLGIYDFKKIKWEFLDITIERKLSERKLSKEKVLDFWYCKHLYSGKNKNPFASPKCEIKLRLPGTGKYNPDLYEVVITEYTGERIREHFPIRKIEPGVSIGYGAWETKGKIRFSIPDLTPPAQPPVPAVVNDSITTKPLVSADHQVYIHPPVLSTGYPGGTETVLSANTIPVAPAPVIMPAKKGGCLGNGLIGIIGISLLFFQPWLGILVLGWMLSRASRDNLVVTAAATATGTRPSRVSFWSILLLAISAWWMYSMWGQNSTGFYILFFGAVLHLFSLFAGSSVWRILTGLVLGLTMIGMSFLLLSGLRVITPQPEKKKTSVKIREKKPLPSPSPGKPDSLFEHYMSWSDFEPRTYEGSYPTTLQDYRQSTDFHRKVNPVRYSGSEDDYWRSMYSALTENDNPKLDSLVKVFQIRSLEKNLNTLETAEMIISYIQQIPYVLVHDESCSVVISGGNEFMRNYHFEGRPCISEIPAGVQSPYEFAHNLKGDCDTRSLFAFSILSELRIPCSIWVSTAYGHSVVGIGLPAGGSNFKYSNGRRHFGTELTATGFRLGMLAPDQTDMDNWKIALETNF
jgi:hypothetical protein